MMLEGKKRLCMYLFTISIVSTVARSQKPWRLVRIEGDACFAYNEDSNPLQACARSLPRFSISLELALAAVISNFACTIFGKGKWTFFRKVKCTS